MSVRIMSVVWGIPMTPTQKLVLLALADNCNDMGECYPSILTICEKSGLSERGVQGAISEMEKMGLVNRFMRKGRSTLYTITPAGYAPPQEVHPAPRAPAPAPDAPPPPQEVHPTPAPRAPITVNEPSIEPSRNRNKNKTQKPAFVLPDWFSDADRKNWDAWNSIPKRRNASNERLEAAIEQLSDWRKQGIDWSQALKNSAVGGWQGLFEPKARASPSNPSLDFEMPMISDYVQEARDKKLKIAG